MNWACHFSYSYLFTDMNNVIRYGKLIFVWATGICIRLQPSAGSIPYSPIGSPNPNSLASKTISLPPIHVPRQQLANIREFARSLLLKLKTLFF